MSTELNIYQKVNAVMKNIDYVQKDAQITGGGANYKAVTHDAVIGLVRKEMVTAGIVVRVEQVGGKVLQMRSVQGDKTDIKQHFYRGRYIVNFVNIDDPKDFIAVQVEAHATDTQDKAPGKAMSYGVKMAVLKTFSIETGENEESRYYETPLYTPEQLAVYHELVDQGKAYEFYLFTATLPQDALDALYNSFPDGKKSQGKKKVTELSKAGREELDNTVDEIKARLAKHDISVLELTGEMSIIEKRFVSSLLTDFEINELSKIKNASEGG